MSDNSQGQQQPQQQSMQGSNQAQTTQVSQPQQQQNQVSQQQTSQNDNNNIQQQQNTQQQQQHQQQQQQQGIVIRQSTPGPNDVTQQALIINTANISQQQVSAVSIQQQHQAQQSALTLQQPQITIQHSQGQPTQITSIPIQMTTDGGGNATITTAMHASLGSLPLQMSQANTINSINAMQVSAGNGLQQTLQQTGGASITSMAALQQQQTVQGQQAQAQQQSHIQQIGQWEGGRVQLLHPMSNGGYLQCNSQGQIATIVNGNLALPTNITNTGAIQIIPSGKPLQSNQLTTTPHMFTQGKQLIATQGQTASFQNYSNPSSNNQTFLISQVVNQPTNILPAQNVNNNKQQDLQKYSNCNNNRTVQQNTQQMQFTQWPFGTTLPQGFSWAPQQPALLAQNVYIRGNQQQDGQQNQQTPMFIQSPPPQHIQTHSIIQNNQNIHGIAQAVPTSNAGLKSRPQDNTQPKTSNARQMPILPSVSTAGKMRPKAMIRNNMNLTAQKLDTSNQSKSQTTQHHKMVLTNTGTLVATSGTQYLTEKVQIQSPNQGKTQQQHQQQQQQQIVQVSAYQQQQQQQQQQHTSIQPKPATSLMGLATMATAHQNNSTQQITFVDLNGTPIASVSTVPQSTSTITTTTTPTTTILTTSQSETVDTTIAPSRPNQTPTKEDDSKYIPTMPPVIPPPNSDVTKTTNATEEVVKEKTLPKAMVKPQILTHVIEGFVIHEADEPFPIYQPALTSELPQSIKALENNKQVVVVKNGIIDEDNNPAKKQKMDDECEMCNRKLDAKGKLKKSKRFCSIECSKRFNMANSSNARKNNSFTKAENDSNNRDWKEKSNNPVKTNDHSPMEVDENSASAETTAKKSNPTKWTVSDVCEFIRGFPGCSEYADDFDNQDIDGQALMLLKENHLTSVMSMKLGPALKLVAKIDTLREEFQLSNPQNGTE